jgi:hypothetical protein
LGRLGMAHLLLVLAETYLKLTEFEKAREQAQSAVERAEGSGSVALIVLGGAPASLGREQEAIHAFKTFPTGCTGESDRFRRAGTNRHP